MRLVSLLPSATEIVYALGLGDDLVGVTFECDEPPEARTDKTVVVGGRDTRGMTPAQIDAYVKERMAAGADLYTLHADALAELAPDLILTQDLCRVCALPSDHVSDALDHLGCRADVLSLDPYTLDAPPARGHRRTGDLAEAIVDAGEHHPASLTSICVHNGLIRFRTRNVRNHVYGGAMTNSDYWWEPPLAGTEAEHLVGALDRLRTTFRWKADALDAAGLRTRIGASALTLGGLLKHVARAEDQMFGAKLSGAPPGPPWDAADWDADPDWDFNSAADDTPEQLYALWDSTVERSRARLDAALADGGLDRFVHLSGSGGRQFSLRRLLCDLIEEYGRHTGHADLLREAVDGLVGEDPPAGWHPLRPRRSAGQ